MATLDVFPQGAAAENVVMPITQLNPSPDFEEVIETCGGRGERVDAPDALLPALERSFETLRAGRRRCSRGHLGAGVARSARRFGKSYFGRQIPVLARPHAGAGILFCLRWR